MCKLSVLRVLSFFLIVSIQDGTFETINDKIWKPNNNIFNKNNWVYPDQQDDCGKVEFGKINTAGIFIDKLTAKEFILPISGDIILLEGGYLELVNWDSEKKTNCLTLKELNHKNYLNPDNWNSILSDNPAVPDIEKIPCSYDNVKFPNGIYSAVNMGDIPRMRSISSLEFINESFDRPDLEAFKVSDIGHSVFYESIDRITITRRVCYDSTGCTCNRDNTVKCPPKKQIECLTPVTPFGFCQKICGAFITFRSENGFSLKRIRAVLEDYADVKTHVSKIADDRIQVVFAEPTYTGESVEYAKKFYEKLQQNSKTFKITNLGKLHISGVQTRGNFSIWIVLLMSLFFVFGLFAIIFYTYGYYELPFGIRFSAPTSFPLSSTYRARFSSKEDESGLIFDNQSLVGSVMNLNQSFDNPMYGQVSTAPDINGDDRDIVKEAASGKKDTKIENQSDPLKT
ncbi:hypothetical protein WA026_012529 [Henosepilachna vigintioctopunctata]|uniref:Protein amnionless n=1 Tax=Henosepilachna vigintioctopunctata TaxID=420089 RepID=A0AAW1U005_9CUCU